MSKKYKYLIAFLILGILALVFFWSSPPSDREYGGGKSKRQATRDSSVQTALTNEPPVKDSLSKEQIEQVHGQSKLERMKELIRWDYSTPIDFWGEVIDQNGNPLAGVKAEIVVDERAGNKKYFSFSDKEGLFELLGKKGARARIKVFLSGYVPTSDEKIGSNVSARTIYYAPKTKPMPAYAPPTRGNPQVFVLRKKNPIANLANSITKRVAIFKDGKSKKVTLKTKSKDVEMEIRCWSSCPVPFTYDKYDWSAEIRIIGGEIQPITEYEPITAPIDGYRPAFKVEMPKNTDKTWKAANVRQRNFWIQFDDGTYAKARIEVKTGRKHEVDAEVWYNLDGTNNFEQ